MIVSKRPAARIGRGGRRAALAVAIVLALAPIYWLVQMATESETQVVAKQPPLFPSFSSFGGISHPPADAPIAAWFLNTGLVSAGTSVLAVLLATIAAFGLSRFRFRGNGPLRFLVLFTQMLPGTLLIVPLYAMITQANLLNNLLSLVLVDTAFVMPVCLWIIKGSMDSIPRELDEAALVDGSTMLGVLRRVVMPLAVPGIGAAAVIAFFFGWNDFLFANTFMISQNKWTLSKGLDSMIGLYSTPVPLIMAVAVLYCLPPMVFFVAMQRRLVSGLTAGAVKA
jgi:multiple sugar transport system permease protein